jgi:hypothetical protein
MSDMAEGRTIYSALTMASQEVQLLKEDTLAWTITMDKSVVRIIMYVKRSQCL